MGPRGHRFESCITDQFYRGIVQLVERWILSPDVASSSLATPAINNGDCNSIVRILDCESSSCGFEYRQSPQNNAFIAQLVEHSPDKRQVNGSNPFECTNFVGA